MCVYSSLKDLMIKAWVGLLYILKLWSEKCLVPEVFLEAAAVLSLAFIREEGIRRLHAKLHTRFQPWPTFH